MKTLIAYCSETGSSKEVAKYISKQFENSKVVNLSEETVEIKNYDKIILGSGIYFSKIHKDLKDFIEDNKELLLKKKFAIFYSCASKDEKKQTNVKTKNFDPQLSSKAMAICCVGGKLNLNKGTLPVKMVVKTANFFTTKVKKENSPVIDYEKVDDFIEIIKNVSL